MSGIKIDAFCPVGIGGTKGIDTTHLKVFVGGLLPNHTSKDLYDIFASFGVIRESVVIPDRFRVRSRCYGFVTFADHESVSEVFRKSPITTSNGAKLTVVLASANTKPRRAHFNVKHGTSGHKPLPMVKEEEDAFKRDAVPPKSIMVKAKTKNRYSKTTKIEETKVGIYTDPSLFRTANIQPIAPASFHVKEKKKSIQDDKPWPNEDIKKDFYNLTKVTVPDDHNQYRTEKKSWKLVAVEEEMDNDSYYGYDENDLYHDDDFYSVNSRKWTPISNKRTCGGDSLSNSVISLSSKQSQDYRLNYEMDENSKRNKLKQQRRRKPRRGKGGKVRVKWVKSPRRTIKSEQEKEKEISTKTNTDKVNGSGDEMEQEEEEEDRLTFASLFDGSYQNLLMDSQKQQTPKYGKVESAEMEHLRFLFRNRMQQKIIDNYGESKSMFNQNHNGTWSPYQPMFSTASEHYSYPDNTTNDNNAYQNGIQSGYNYNNIIPTPPIQPIVLTANAYSGSIASLNPFDINTYNGTINVNDNSPVYNIEQTNVVCNTNYFLDSSSNTK